MSASNFTRYTNERGATNGSPPAYTEYDSMLSSQHQPRPQTPGPYQPIPPPLLPVPVHHHNLFGPTPLNSQRLIPYAYYDPRSPYSITQADARARWRFAGSALIAFGLWVLVGFLVGVEVVGSDGGDWEGWPFTSQLGVL